VKMRHVTPLDRLRPDVVPPSSTCSRDSDDDHRASRLTLVAAARVFSHARDIAGQTCFEIDLATTNVRVIPRLPSRRRSRGRRSGQVNSTNDTYVLAASRLPNHPTPCGS
jgi:hypothetical protein